jgi:hypothetical protein
MSNHSNNSSNHDTSSPLALWNDTESAAFDSAFEATPNEFEKIAVVVKTKTVLQCKYYYAVYAWNAARPNERQPSLHAGYEEYDRELYTVQFPIHLYSTTWNVGVFASPLPRDTEETLSPPLRGKLAIFKHPLYERGVMTKDRLTLPKDGAAGKLLLICRVDGKHINHDDLQSAAYAISNNRSGAIDLVDHWTGKINHAPEACGKANVKAFNHNKSEHLYLIKEVPAGAELFMDYGVSYWTCQVTQLDIVVWLELLPESLLLWTYMHRYVLDYRKLIALKLCATRDLPVMKRVITIVTREIGIEKGI